MAFADLFVIPWLVANETVRRASRGLRSGSAYKWRYTGTATSGVKFPVENLRPTNPELANEFYAGTFRFAGTVVTTGGGTPFLIDNAKADWMEELHSFRWINHLIAAETSLARAQAIALIEDWIEHWGSDFQTMAWRSDIVSTRLIAWLTCLPVLSQDMSEDQHVGIMKSLSKQCRYLGVNAPNVRDGYPRLHAMIALTYNAICVAGREKHIKPCSIDLDRELDRQILADGGHISRNPSVLVELLADLVPLLNLFRIAEKYPPAHLISSMDRMTQALRFFLPGGYELANFNGTRAISPDLIKSLLQATQQSDPCQQSSPQSGYERLEGGKTVIIMDCGKPLSHASATTATAGTLSFELSSDGTRFIGNCGTPEYNRTTYAPFVRATAAHSTATISDRSSSRFADSSFLHSLLPSAFIRGPVNIPVERATTDGFSEIKTSHDGYREDFGLIHHRTLQLSEDGTELNGADQISSAGRTRRQSRQFALRFHLPANITASFLSSGNAVLLAGPQNSAWVFTCIDTDIRIEESIQFCGVDGPRKSEQIALYADVTQSHEIRWHMAKSEKKPPARNRATSEASGDLLEGLAHDDDVR